MKNPNGILSGTDIPGYTKKEEVSMRKVSLGLLFSLVFLLFASYNAYAENGCRIGKSGMGGYGDGMDITRAMKHRGMGMLGDGHRIWKNLRGLGLDEKQKEAIKEVSTRVLKDTIKTGADIRIARVELKEILAKDPIDVNAAGAKLKQIESMKSEIFLARIKAFEEIKAKLTPEQREKFMKNLREHRRWKRDGRKAGPAGDKKGEPRPKGEHMGRQ